MKKTIIPLTVEAFDQMWARFGSEPPIEHPAVPMRKKLAKVTGVNHQHRYNVLARAKKAKA